MSEIIASVSGIRGIYGDSLTPQNIIKFTSAFAELCKHASGKNRNKLVIGRDGRLHGDIIQNIVSGNLALSGFEVIDIGIAPTPTVQIATEELKCCGGVSVTASHNPQEWNGLKFLNANGTFLDAQQVKKLLKLSETGKFSYANVNSIIPIKTDNSWIERHVEKVLSLKILKLDKIRKRKFKVVVDAVNASGSMIVPMLLKELGCKVITQFCDMSGIFPHTPEPVPQNLKLLMQAVRKNNADIGIAVDPDADRLVLITDEGEPFGEENTITTAINFVVRQSANRNRNVTVNLSTTRSVDDIAKKYNAKVFRSPVGEINVVGEMKKNHSIIGGEGSGGVIYPELHFGRDSLAGIVLILNELVDYGNSLSEYKKALPQYFISKSKINISGDPDKVLKEFKKKYSAGKDVINISEADGLKIDFKNYWVHMRKSNTEPIIRIITEAGSKKEAEELQKKFLKS